MTSLCDPFPNLPLSLLTPFPPFVLPCRWVRAAAVRWPSCPQCLEPAGCCWWGWPCPQTIGWSWWRASSYSRTRAWRWRWRCIQASGEFASWLVGRHDDMFEYSLLEDALIHTQKQCCYVCVHMSTSSQQQTHGKRTKRERGGGKRDSYLSQNMFVTCEQDCRDPTWFFFLFVSSCITDFDPKSKPQHFLFFSVCVFPQDQKTGDVLHQSTSPNPILRSPLKTLQISSVSKTHNSTLSTVQESAGMSNWRGPLLIECGYWNLNTSLQLFWLIDESFDQVLKKKFCCCNF